MKNVLSVAAVSLAVTAVFALSVTPAFAESSKKLTDDADIITSSQEETIENNLKKCTLATGWDTIIYTNNNNVDSYDMEDYCNDYFDNHNYGCGDKKSGVMLTIDMSSREMYIITKGEAMYCFSDARTDDLLDSVQYELSSGDYDGACDEFIETVEQYYNAGVDTSKDASYSNIIEAQLTPLEKVIKGFLYGIMFMMMGGLAGFLVSLGVRYAYGKNGKGASYDLAKNSSLNLTESRDQFLYKNVTYTTVSSSSSSSSSHRSHRSSSSHRSSHSSHGGGGRHF